MKKFKYMIVLGLLTFGLGSSQSFATVSTMSNTDFENGSLSGWDIGSQTGSLVNGTITGMGTGATLISNSVSFSSDSHGSVGNPTVGGLPNPYYAPEVGPNTWTFSPYGTYGVALQPNNQQTFDDATTALGLSSSENIAIKSMLSTQASQSGNGSGTPTDASWITKLVTLNAGTTYTMSWNYIGTDYVPFNDGSITSLVYQGSDTSPVITVNNGASKYALLGFTNPGTGDYSTGTFGSTGWQVSTYEVSVTGDYLLGFVVFNLDDTALSPVLLVDSQPGTTLKNGENFGAVTPNNPDAPVVTTTPPTTMPAVTTVPSTTIPETTTEAPTTVPVTTTIPPTTIPETTTTTTVPETTTEAPTTVPETTTTTIVIETTTVVPTTSPEIVVTPVTEPQVTAPIESLPVTGNGVNLLFVFSMMSILIGSSCIWIRKEGNSKENV